jgi:hypothetical protein
MWDRLAGALMWPGLAAHELAHWFAGRWAAREDRLHIAAARPRYEVVEWVEGAALWVVLVAYAPVLVGLFVGLSVLLIAGLPAPETVTDWCLIGILAGWYAVFVLPSAGDIDTAQEGLDRVRE